MSSLMACIKHYVMNIHCQFHYSSFTQFIWYCKQYAAQNWNIVNSIFYALLHIGQLTLSRGKFHDTSLQQTIIQLAHILKLTNRVLKHDKCIPRLQRVLHVLLPHCTSKSALFSSNLMPSIDYNVITILKLVFIFWGYIALIIFSLI